LSLEPPDEADQTGRERYSEERLHDEHHVSAHLNHHAVVSAATSAATT